MIDRGNAQRSARQIDLCALIPQLIKVERVAHENVDAHSRLIAVHLKNRHSFVADPPFTNSGIGKVSQLDRHSGFIPNAFERLESLERPICNKLNHHAYVLGEPLVTYQIHLYPPD